MSRYIDAEALEYDTEWSEYHDGFTAYSQMAIDTAPSIDLADYVPKEFHDKTCEAMAKAHQEEIADILERADADRPQGEWKPFDLTWGRSIYACSICEEAIAVPCGWSDGKPIYDYCPMCGAHMKGADDE